VSEWAIRIPFRTRDDPLDVDAVIDLPELLDDPEDQAVARELPVEASTSGLQLVGQLLDQLEAASPAARRATLDRMRARAGLDSTADVEAHRASELANSAPTAPRDAGGNEWKACAAAGCNVVPADPATGLPIAVPDRRCGALGIGTWGSRTITSRPSAATLTRGR
jgi:hypothetical protein